LLACYGNPMRLAGSRPWSRHRAIAVHCGRVGFT
jgi:hypothetical protein